DRNRSHWSTSKTPSYTKSVSWQHHPNVRYTGITLGYQLGAALAGGTAPLIATGLLAKYDGDWVPVAWYLAVTVAISLIAIFCASRVKRASLLQAQPEHL
ncbi:hypothetical protein M8N38_21030, partial [Enterobacter asburiae]|nr:hypothetical protein [Enterobacter asburiae]